MSLSVSKGIYIGTLLIITSVRIKYLIITHVGDLLHYGLYDENQCLKNNFYEKHLEYI